jgi:glutaminyl-peptide cyclotransferase
MMNSLARWLFTSFLVLTLAPTHATAAPPAIPIYSYEIVHTYPHDPEAFTEGLFFKDGFLYESTGMQGRSSVRKVRLETGEVLSAVRLPNELFGEGIVDWATTSSA